MEPRAHRDAEDRRDCRSLRLKARRLVTNLAPESQIGHSGDFEVPDSIGGPSRTRTLDPLIKSDGQEQPQQTLDELRPREPE
jgi:hypothetical protein